VTRDAAGPLPHPKRRTSPARLAATGLLLAVAWAISFVFGGVPGEARVALGLAGGVVAPVLATAAAVRLAAPRLTRGRGVAVVAVAAVAFGSLAACSLALGAPRSSVDGADAAGPPGLVGALTLAAAIASAAAFAAVVALVLVPGLRARGLAVRPAVLVASGLGLLAGPLLAWALLVPLPVAAYCGAVLVAAVRPRVRDRVAGALGVRGRATPAALAHPGAVRDRVTLLAGASLAATLIVWASGVAVSLAATGTDHATVGLGVAAALGQLAVLPLLRAASLVVDARGSGLADAGARSPAAAAQAARRIGTALVVLATAGMVLAALAPALGPDAGAAPDPFFPLVGVLSLGVAVAAGAIVWPRAASRTRPERRAVSAVGTAAAVLAIALVYAALVGFTGGVTLALLSAFVAFGGARYVVRDAGPVRSPATPAVS